MNRAHSSPARASHSRPLGALAAGLCSLLAGCGNSILSNDQGPDAQAPASLESLLGDPRVDLPGRVSVFIKVTNGNGTPAADLSGEDFKIYENDVLVSQSESFQQIRAQPQIFRSFLHLILDRSNSVQSVGAESVISGAQQFIDVVTTQESNYVKISWFDGSDGLYPIPGHDIGYTNDRESLIAALNDLNVEPPFSTSTNLYGAVVRGLNDLDAIDAAAADAEVQNRALTLVTFTDGTHQAGDAVTLEDVVARINAGSTNEGSPPYSAFTIGVGQEIDPAVLAALGPDGSVSASEFNALQEAFFEVGDQVRRLANSFYFLTYCSPKRTGLNELRISVQDQPAQGDLQFEFNADGFGAGCAFLDVRGHPELAGSAERTHIADAIETPDGVVAVGWRTDSCDEPGCGTAAVGFIARFRASSASEVGNSDGALDPDFGTGGFMLLSDPLVDVTGATSVAYDNAAGRFVVGGWSRETSSSGFSRASLWAVGADGGDVTRVDLGEELTTNEAITSLVAIPDAGSSAGDGYVAGGFRGDGNGRSFALWRLFDNLALDSAFDGDGKLLSPAAPEPLNGGVTAMVAGPGGRVYVAGNVGTTMRLMALDRTSGAPITAFGGTGTVEPLRQIGGVTYAAQAGGLVIDGLGSVLLAGTLRDPVGQSQPAIWKIDSAGEAVTGFQGSLSSPTFGSGVVTLRSANTDSASTDFGEDSGAADIALGPDGTIMTVGERINARGDTDLTLLSFDGNGIPDSTYNFVGFVIDDGASAERSFEAGSRILVLSSGAIWALGASSIQGLLSPDIPTVWVDRDPARAFAPLGN